MNHIIPDSEYLHKLLIYKPDTGLLFWKPRSPDMFNSGKQARELICSRWNSKNAQKEAFVTLRKGYKNGAINGVNFAAHRIIWTMQTGAPPSGLIDHVNGIRTDNRMENLRDVSMSENLKNRCIGRRNKSGCLGVFFNGSNWTCQIGHSGRAHHVGQFETFDEAVDARRRAEAEHGFHKNHGRSE